MARQHSSSDPYMRPMRRIFIGLLVFACLAVFVLWRIDSPRVERLRSALIDRFISYSEWAMVPASRSVKMLQSFQSYQKLYEQNRDLRDELKQMRAWREAALRLEQQNAKLLGLNNVRLDPKLAHITGVVLADSASPFRQSVLVNVGARDGIRDGWAAMDGIGLVGRIAGVAERTSRVILLTDSNSRIPVVVQQSGQSKTYLSQKALLSGDNTPNPPLEFLEKPDLVSPGDQVVTSGDGGVLPAGLVVGQVEQSPDRRLRVRLAADYDQLEFLRVLRSHMLAPITDTGGLVAPPLAPHGPPPKPAASGG